MRQRFLAARGYITALLVILLSFCLALGVRYAVSPAVYAEEETGNTAADDGQNETDGTNEWFVTPILVGWTEGRFDKESNFIAARPKYGEDEMYFRIFENRTVADTDTQAYQPVSFNNNGTEDTKFSLDENNDIPAYVADVLKDFKAGTYYLLAVVPAAEDGSYTGLNDEGSLTQDEIKEKASPFKVLVKTEIKSVSITEWEWSAYKYGVNVIISDIVCDESLTVYYAVHDSENKRVENLSPFTIDESGAVVEPLARMAFENLPAGNYSLIVYTSDPNSMEEPYSVPFKVAPYSNGWLVEPGIIEWTWGGFNLNVNRISGAARKNDSGRVYFGVYTDEDTAYSTALERFTVSESGIVNESAAPALGNLDAGEYLLKCWTENDDTNYTDISATVKFKVNEIENEWLIVPYVLSWKYGDFDKNLNTFNCKALFGDATCFAIYRDEDCTDAVTYRSGNAATAYSLSGGGEWFMLDENGLVTDEVASVLNTINAGTYYLACRVMNINGNYANLLEIIPFNVLKVQNTWITAPSVISWNEGQFNEKDNFLNGVAKAGQIKFTITDGNDKLLYTVLKDESGAIVSVTGADGGSVHISALNKLSVGSYKMLAEVENTDNYSTLSTTVYFAVFEDSVALGGIIAATVTFALIDLIAAGLCIALLIIRRRKVENQFRRMVTKELHRR